MEDLITLLYFLGVCAYVLVGMIFGVLYSFGTEGNDRMHVLTPVVALFWPVSIAVMFLYFTLWAWLKAVWRAYTLPQVH